jgi:hypothetical protein
VGHGEEKIGSCGARRRLIRAAVDVATVQEVPSRQ